MWNLNLGREDPMSAEAAALYARKMIDLEASASGDIPGALDRLARRYGVSKWTLERLRKGRTKRVEVSLFGRLRAAYLAECERQITKLQNELAIERAMGGCPDNMDDFENEARQLLAKVAAQKSRPYP